MKTASVSGLFKTYSDFHSSFRRFSLISLFLFSYLTFKTFPEGAQRPQILARNRIAAANAKSS